ncbi:MAG: 2-hydroxychromene-2-carboxylate isomerase [Myxococcota bacterium]
MSAQIEFFFDIGSPYSYLAATQLDALGQRLGTPIWWRPFLLGGVFKAVGNQPPAMLPARGRYMLRDLNRWAARYQVSFSFPSTFPLNTLLPMRALTALEPDRCSQAALTLFNAYWVDDQDLTRPDVIADLIGEEAVRMAVDPDTKALLRATTDDAIERGAFGAPTIFVGDEMFFGNDRLDFVEALMAAQAST